MLSRVMMSCGGTSSVSMRKLMRVSTSMGQMTIFTPAPFASGNMRPRRSTTPRSHSLMMYSEFQIQISMKPTMTSVPTPKNSNMCPPSALPSKNRPVAKLVQKYWARYIVPLHWLYVEFQALDAHYANGLAFRERRTGKCAPQFAVNADHAFCAVTHRRNDNALRTDHFLAPGGVLPFRSEEHTSELQSHV